MFVHVLKNLTIVATSSPFNRLLKVLGVGEYSRYYNLVCLKKG